MNLNLLVVFFTLTDSHFHFGLCLCLVDIPRGTVFSTQMRQLNFERELKILKVNLNVNGCSNPYIWLAAV